jgi:hypothetical protein
MGKTPLEIFDELQQRLARPDGTEARLVSDLLEDHISNSETVHGTIPEEALDHFDTMLEELLVATMSVRRAFNRLREHPGNQCPIPFTLCSAGGDGSVLDGRIEITCDGIEVGFKGYGTPEVKGGAPIRIEQQNGVVRVRACHDINDPPGYPSGIGLGFAREEFRINRDQEGDLCSSKQ